jgi:hypothetical protein
MGSRWGRVLALAAVVTMALALTPVAVAQAATATLAASPDTNLRDEQAITVTASGYPTNAELDLVECEENFGCDFSNLMVLQSGTTGGYTTTFNVHRLLQLSGPAPVDCAAAQDCILVSLDISDLSTGAQTPITFDPNAPVKPPLRFRITPAANDNVQVAKGVARITGTVSCNRPVDIDVEMQLTQVWHEQIFTSEIELAVSCSHGGRFSAAFRPVNGLFGAGAATVRIDAFGFAVTNYNLAKFVTVNLVPVS